MNPLNTIKGTIGAGVILAIVIGLISMAAYFADLISGANVLVGLIERGATHPFLIGLICAGVLIWNRRSLESA